MDEQNPTAPEPAKTTAKDVGRAAPPASARKSSWLRLTVVILFALFYAYDLFEAISNLFGKVDEINRSNEFRELNGINPIDVPWVFLIANLLLPVLVFLVASLLGRRRGVSIHALLYLVGLGVVAAASLTFVNLVRTLY